MIFGDSRKATFKRAYKTIAQYIHPFTDDPRIDAEIAAALIVLYDFGIFNTHDILTKFKLRKNMANLIIPYAAKLTKTNIEHIQKRMDFYGLFIRGKSPRFVYNLGNDTPDFSENPLGRLIFAFADVVYDTALIDNYHNSPMLIKDIFENMKFITTMKEKVTPAFLLAMDKAIKLDW